MRGEQRNRIPHEKLSFPLFIYFKHTNSAKHTFAQYSSSRTFLSQGVKLIRVCRLGDPLDRLTVNESFPPALPQEIPDRVNITVFCD